MKKVVKIIVGIVGVLLVLLLGVIISLPLTIGPLVKSAAAVGGPKVLGVSVSVGDVKLKPLAGELIISDLVVGNPKGYSDKPAFAVKTVDVDLKTLTILKGNVIQIEKILIDSPAISYETKDGVSNFDAMLAKSQTAEKTEGPEDSKDKPDVKSKKKVVIDEFILNGSKVSYSSKITFGKAITIPLPSVTVHDIGKASGGASMIEALNQVIASIGGGLKDAITGLASGSVDALKDVSAGATDALGNVSEGVTGAVGDISGDAADVADDLTKGAADAAGDAADAAGDAVNDASKKLKGLFGN